MLDKIIGQILLVLLNWFEKRINLSQTAVDADSDIDSLRRAGSRIDEWVRKQNDLHSREQSNEDRS